MRIKKLMVLASSLLLAAGLTLGGAPLAQAAIYDGGGSGTTVSTGSGGTQPPREWGFGTSLADYAYSNKLAGGPLNWGASWPVYNVDQGAGGGGTKVFNTIAANQPNCLSASTGAVFGLQYVQRAGGYTQYIHSVTPTNSNHVAPAQRTYAYLLQVYNSRMGASADPSIVAQLQAMGSAPIPGGPAKSFICIDTNVPPPPPPPDPVIEYRVIDNPVYSPVYVSDSITCIYSKAVAVTRQNIVNPDDTSLIDHIGKDNLEDQPATAAKTSFGDLVDQYNATPPTDAAAAMAALQAACDSDTAGGGPNPKVDLSANNQEGLAEGGVLNVREHVRRASFAVSENWEELTGCTAVRERREDGGPWVFDSDVACEGTYPATRAHSGVTSNANVDATQQTTGFWQIIAVHCNEEGYTNLVPVTAGIQQVNTGDGSKAFSAMAYSQAYTSVPLHLDFGDSTNPNAAKAATGFLGFYDKECPFVCTADEAGPGASAANGATENVGNAVPAAGGTVGRYGAVSGNNNDNKFTFFRDNQPKNIKLDVWYPRTTGVVTYDGSAPITTTVTKWDKGTPSVDGSDGGQFTMKTAGESPVPVFGSGAVVKNQKNWDPLVGTTPDAAYVFNTPHAALLKGLHREFTVQATWASKDTQPHVLNVKWEYDPQVSTRVATTGLGFAGTGVAARDPESTLSAPIQGKCYANLGTTSSLSTNALFQEWTGTSTSNDLDTRLVEGNPATGMPPENQTNIFIKFVRSTSE